jgi:dolichyl-diphosphooligosaccharide--protein glycosyltransferase
MYRLCYYRFDEIKTSHSKPAGYDVLRGYEMGKKNIKLRKFEEAFTSEHWMIRIYKVKDLGNRHQVAMKNN